MAATSVLEKWRQKAKAGLSYIKSLRMVRALGDSISKTEYNSATCTGI